MAVTTNSAITGVPLPTSAYILDDIVDAKGDLIAATAADTVSRLAIGANATVLTADSAEATGLKWATPAAGGGTLDQSYDQGGAGAGRTITVDSGAVTLTAGGTTVGGFTVNGSRTIASAAGAVWDELLIDVDVALSGSTNVTVATGFNMVSLKVPTITDAGTITSITNAATVYIAGAPLGIGLTITNAYALWIDAGFARFDGQVLGTSGSSAAPSFAFTSDDNTGVYLVSVDALGFAANGLLIAQVDSNLNLSVNPGSNSSTLTVFTNASERLIDTDTLNKGVAFMTTANGVNQFITILPPAKSSGIVEALILTGAAHTAQSAGIEVLDVDFALNATLQHATGAMTTQRSVLIRNRTYSFVAASTIDNAASFAIVGAPIAGANATITNSHALWVQAGNTQLDGGLTLNATNIITDTVTGMKIGTATTQKLGFFNATPVVQGASVADATGGIVIDAEARTAINALISRIEATGLIATV